MYKLFIVHYEPLKERKEYLESVLSKTNIPYEFSAHYTRDNIEEDKFSTDPKVLEEKNKITSTPVTGHGMSNSVKACCLEHVRIYNKIIEEDLDFAIILEDDAMLVEDFEAKLSVVLNTLPAGWDMIYLTNGCQSKPSVVSTHGLFSKRDDRRSWTGGAYMVNKTSAKLYVNNIFPIVYPPDFELTYLQNPIEA